VLTEEEAHNEGSEEEVSDLLTPWQYGHLEGFSGNVFHCLDHQNTPHVMHGEYAADYMNKQTARIFTLTRDLAAAREELEKTKQDYDFYSRYAGSQVYRSDFQNADQMRAALDHERAQLAAANATVAQLIQHGIIAKRTKQSATDDGPDYVILVPMGTAANEQKGQQ
jgi:hypothetical protein